MNGRPILATAGLPEVSPRVDRPTVRVASLDAAVALLDERRPACVVAGVEGPPGTALLAAVRERHPAVPVLLAASEHRPSLFGEHTEPIPDDVAPATLAARLREAVDDDAPAEPSDGERRLGRLRTTVADLLDADSVDDVAEVAVTAAMEVFDLPATGVHLLDEAETALEPVAYSSGAASLFDGEPPTYRPGSTAWEVYESADPLVVEDTGAADIEGTPTRSALVLPLSDHGLFICSSPTAATFSEADEHVASVLASATAAALDLLAKGERLDSRETELAAERERLSGLFRTAPIPAASLHLSEDDGAIVEDVNPAFEATFGYDAADLVGENIDDHIVPEPKREAVQAFNERVAGGEPLETEVERLTADGIRDFQLSMSPFAGDVTYAFYVDITERKQRQQRLQVLSRVLRHDIRNQMNVIAGNAGLLAEALDDPALGERAAGIRRSAGELLALSRKTRRVERLVAGDAPGDEADLVRLVRQHVSSVREGDDTVVTTDVPETAMVEGGEALSVVVDELLANAVEHNDAAETRIEVSVSVERDHVTASVWDNGSGLPPEERAMFRGETGPTQLEHASGLGLWMVKWVVESTGGRLSIDVDGDGTEVGFRVPRARADGDDDLVATERDAV